MRIWSHSASFAKPAKEGNRGLLRSPRVVGWPAFKNAKKNPYNAQLYAALEKHGWIVTEASSRSVTSAPDVVHLHWPDDYSSRATFARSAARLATVIALTGVARLRGSKIVWTVHNLVPHERSFRTLDAIYRFVFPRLVDDAIHLTDESMRALTRDTRWSSKRHHVIPHGPYELRMRTSKRTETKQALIIGQMRGYKGLPLLLANWSRMEPIGWSLLVAGQCSDAELLGVLSTSSKDSSNPVRLVPKFLDQAEIEQALSDSRVMIVSGDRPNSGAMYLGLSAGLHILAPRNSFNQELQDRMGARWITLYAPNFDDFGPNLLMGLGAASGPAPLVPWDEIAERTSEAFHGTR